MIIKNLQILSTCVNYSDYLAYTLPYNKLICDNIVIATNKNDKETKDLCVINNTEYVEYNNLGEDNKPFNWCGAYNFLLEQYTNQWILITDADILLPKNLDTIFADVLKDNFFDTLYYTSRVYIPMDYENIEINIEIAKKEGTYDKLGWAHMPPQHWGYFLLFFNDGKKKWTYNDVEFAKSFKNQTILPKESCVCHIPHGTWDDWGKNFHGRKTPKLEELVRNKVKY